MVPPMVLLSIVYYCIADGGGIVFGFGGTCHDKIWIYEEKI